MVSIKDSAVALRDGFRNVVSGLSGPMDGHSTGASWYLRPITQQEIEASYRGSWICKKVHDIPVTDMLAPWRSWDGTPDQIKAIVKEEKRHGLKRKTRKSGIFARLYGGSCIMIGIKGQEPSEPLDLNTIKQGDLSYLHVLTKHEVTVDGMDLDPASPHYGEPLAYIVNGGGSMVKVHPSRMARFTFGELPDQLAMGQSGWGDPLMQSLREALVNADTAQGSFAALCAKARTSTLKIPGLLNLISTKEGEEKFMQKTRLAKTFESMFGLNVIAAPARAGEAGEEYETESFNFGGIPEMGMWMVQMVAAATGLPMTKMVGASPGGLNSTGTGDENSYIQILEAGRELDITPPLDMIDEVLIRSATGGRDDKIGYGWEPFQAESEKDKVANSKARAESLKILSESGSVPSDVLMKMAKGQIIDSGDYPGAEDAYAEYEAAGGDFEPVEAPTAANDNPVMNAAIEGGVASGKSASVAARDAAVMLADSRPMTLYVDRAVTNFAAIRAHFEGQGVTVTIDDDTAHVTLAYSRQPVDWLSVGTSDWGGGSPNLTVPEGGPRIMDVFNGTLVQIFGSSQLSYRHEEIVRAGATWDYDQFNPHFSLNYQFGSGSIDGIKPWTGPIELGCERFSEIKED